MFRKTAPLLLTALIAVSQIGCIRKTLIVSQAKASQEGGEAVNEVADYDIARTAIQNSAATLEGMNRLAPNQEVVLMQLTRTWVTYGFVFAQDDMDSSEDGSDDYEVNKARTVFAYQRAVKYGLQRLAMEAEGFDAARKNEASLKSWLRENFDDKEDAELLFWVGYAWMARVTVLRDHPEMVADLWVGVKLIERSLELDPNYNNSNGLTALAAYHARASIGELDEAKALFEKALATTKRQSLLTQVNYATRYACLKGDRALYDSLISEVLKFDITTAPNQALPNTVAKRRARRAFKKEALVACGFDPNAKSSAPTGAADGEPSLEDFLAPSKNLPPGPSSVPPVLPATTASVTTPTPNLPPMVSTAKQVGPKAPVTLPAAKAAPH